MNYKDGSFSYTFNNQLFTSACKLASALGLRPTTFLKYLQSSITVDEAIATCKSLRKKGLDYDGKHYNSINELADAFNIGRDILKSRIHHKKMSYKEALETPVRKMTIVGLITYNGKDYNGYGNLAKAFNMSDTCLRDRLDSGMSLEEALSKPVKDSGKPKPITYNGKEYPSRSDLARELGIPEERFLSRLNNGMPLDLAVSESPLYEGTPRPIDFRGIHYNSLKDLAEAFSIKYYLLVSRLLLDWSLEMAITEPAHSTKTTYNGKLYNNNMDLSREFNIPVEIIRARLRNGWTLERTVSTPVRHRKSKYD